MTTYEQTMQDGEREYADVLDALNVAGLPTSFTQTGGMCAALETRLEGGLGLLITAADDTLPWRRSDLVGWGVGLYSRGDLHDDLPLAYASTPDIDIPSLVAVIAGLIHGSMEVG
jgi:hypothetical protein